MKISILIPVYNFDVEELVKELSSQCGSAQGLSDYEIVLLDDASKEKFQNSKLVSGKVFYEELTENIGRSKIRNQLASQAKFEALLFLDCDSAIEKDDFIKAYVQHYQENSVVYGGRTYSKDAPEDIFYFRWKYGVEREIIPADKRILNPYNSFMTNNFLITKTVFQDLKFDETLKGYGHEDTLFGIELRDRKIPIIHIENPAVHIGLETADEFLNKTKEGIVNLHHLYKTKKVKGTDVKLLGYYNKFRIFPIKPLFLSYFKRKEAAFLNSVNTQDVRVRDFDFYKLSELLKL